MGSGVSVASGFPQSGCGSFRRDSKAEIRASELSRQNETTMAGCYHWRNRLLKSVKPTFDRQSPNEHSEGNYSPRRENASSPRDRS